MFMQDCPISGFHIHQQELQLSMGIPLAALPRLAQQHLGHAGGCSEPSWHGLLPILVLESNAAAYPHLRLSANQWV